MYVFNTSNIYIFCLILHIQTIFLQVQCLNITLYIYTHYIYTYYIHSIYTAYIIRYTLWCKIMLCPVDEFSTEDPLPGPRPPWPGGQGDVSRRRSWGRNPGRKMLRAPRKNGGIIDVSWCFMIWNRDVFQFRMFRLEQGLEHWILRMFERRWVWKVWYLIRSGAPTFWSICL